MGTKMFRKSMTTISEIMFASIALVGLGVTFAVPAEAGVVYNNLTPNNQMAIASRPELGGAFEIEAADDFVLSSETTITSASFVGLNVLGTGGTPSVSEIVIEFYRVFPLDSNIARTPNVPTRTNSPSD